MTSKIEIANPNATVHPIHAKFPCGSGLKSDQSSIAIVLGMDFFYSISLFRIDVFFLFATCLKLKVKCLLYVSVFCLSAAV